MDLLQKVKSKKIDPITFTEKIWELSHGRSREGVRYNGTKEKPIRIYRARLWKREDLPKDISELSYPPLPKAALGRANLDGTQVFYASAGLPTTFVENKKVSVGDVIIATEWRCHSTILLQKVGFVSGENLDDYEQLLHDLFCHVGSNLFEYSASIAQHLMSGDVLHGITYPSIESQNDSQNFALKKEFVDSSLTFVNATAYRVDEIPKNHTYKTTEFDFATSVGSNLDWKQRKKSWVIREDGGELKMVASGWGWDAYDRLGKLVDPE